MSIIAILSFILIPSILMAIVLWFLYANESKVGVRYDDTMFNQTGSWTFKSKKELRQHHFFDKKLCDALIEFFDEERCFTIIDLGCGMGDYIFRFNRTYYVATGIDGHPDTWNLTNGHGYTEDLSKPIRFQRKYDWALSLEVGEHIPSEYEDIFLDNIANSCKRGVVMSWAVEGQGGLGHVNCRNNDWVENKMKERGFWRDVYSEQQLRNAAKIKWFKNTLMVYKKHDND